MDQLGRKRSVGVAKQTMSETPHDETIEAQLQAALDEVRAIDNQLPAPLNLNNSITELENTLELLRQERLDDD